MGGTLDKRAVSISSDSAGNKTTVTIFSPELSANSVLDATCR
jgi:hypothetical protein